MHRIIKAHLESYVKSQGLENEDEASQFEKFVNFSVISTYSSTAFDIEEVTTGAGDDGVDGVSVVIDEEVTTSHEDAKNIIFSSHRRNHDVTVVFVQAKRSEGFDLGDFLKFKESILRFVSQTPYSCPDETMATARQVFDVVLSEVPKIRNGKPSLIARFVTTGIYHAPPALETAIKDFCAQLNELGLFAETDVRFIGRDELTQLWVGTYSGVQSSLELFSSAALPTISGINEAYLAVVRASDFVKNLLLTPDGNLRTHVFEENVRSFLGLENSVNQSISATLQSSDSSRFPVLNNGITIVSPDVRLQGNTLHLTNYHIVNGCQTSNVLFERRGDLGDTMVNIKVVETQNEDVFSELVRATNSQTKVEDTQFLSLRPIIKSIEQYFSTFDDETRLYFERRDRQFVGQNIPAIRIFSVHSSAKCVTAMFCNRPELAARYQKTMYEELTETLFSENAKEAVFYASCLTLYRFSMLVSNSTIPQNMKRFKWHILPLVRVMICGEQHFPINSKDAERSALKIIEKMASHSPSTTKYFVKAVEICQSLGDVNVDMLKRQSLLSTMRAKIGH